MNVVILRRKLLGHTSCVGISSFSKEGITFIRNDKLHTIPSPDMVIRWGCTSNVDTKNVINKAAAIHAVSNKRTFRELLDELDLCPRTWLSQASFYLDNVPSEPYPVIVRRATHSQGNNLHVCNTPAEVAKWCVKYGEGNYYISAIIDKVKEFRVFVVQGRAACVAEKIPASKDDIAWNVAKGGKFVNVKWDNWPLLAIKKSIEAFSLSGLDFGGVDVMLDKEGKPYIIEINSAPSLTSPYRQECMAKCFDWLVAKGKGTINLQSAKGGYSKFIHPAITSKAKLT